MKRIVLKSYERDSNEIHHLELRIDDSFDIMLRIGFKEGVSVKDLNHFLSHYFFSEEEYE